MINSETSCNGGDSLIPGNNKLPTGVMKKTALRDVQNQKGAFIVCHQENLPFAGGRSATGAVKGCGTKRLTPERPPPSPSQFSLTDNAVKEQIVNVRRRFDLELGRGRGHNHVEKFSISHHEVPQRQTQFKESNNARVPVVPSNKLTSQTNFSHGGPSVLNHVGNYGCNMQVADGHKVSCEQQGRFSTESIDERRRTERFIQLQNFLKQCDESYQSDYIQGLLRSSPGELSERAVSLEKRAIQLTIEEGKEIQRMKMLNILEKSAPPGNSLQPAPLHHPRN